MLEITDNGNLGVIYESNNSKGLSDKLEKMINNYQIHLQKAWDNKDSIAEKYSIENYINNLEYYYQELLKWIGHFESEYIRKAYI